MGADSTCTRCTPDGGGGGNAALVAFSISAAAFCTFSIADAAVGRSRSSVWRSRLAAVGSCSMIALACERDGVEAIRPLRF